MRKRRLLALLLTGCMLFSQTVWAAETEETQQSVQEVQKTDGTQTEIPWDQLNLVDKEIYAQLPEFEISNLGEEHTLEDFHVVVEDESVCSLEVSYCVGNTVTYRFEGKKQGTTRAAIYYYQDGTDDIFYGGLYNITVKDKPADAADIQDAAMNYVLRSNGIDGDSNGYISSSEIESLTDFSVNTSDNPGVRIQDWSALGQMENLGSISIQGYDMEDLGFLSLLAHPGKIYSFSFQDGTLGDCSALSYLTQMNSLTLSGVGLTDLSFLQYIDDPQMLYWLDLSGNQITDISALEGLNLDYIALSDNPKLENVDSLLSLTNLQTVYLDHTSVSEDDRWEVAGIPDSITIGKREQVRIPKVTGLLGSDFMIGPVEGSDTDVIALEKEDYDNRYIVTGNKVGSAKLRIAWGQKMQDISVTVTAPEAQEYTEQIFPGATLNRWASIDLTGCRAVSDNEAVCKVALYETMDTIAFSGIAPGKANISILDSDGDVLAVYRVTVKEDQPVNVYIGAPIYAETNIYVNGPEIDEETVITVEDESVCKAELVCVEETDYAGNPYYTLQIRMEGLKEGQTGIKIDQYGEPVGRYKVTVKELPDDAVQIEDEKVRSAMLSASGGADTNKDGYLTREELDNCRYLNLQNCGLTDLSILKEVPGLYTLDISGNQLTDLTGIEMLKNLYTLYARENRLTSIKGMEMLTNLSTAEFSGNEGLQDISPLYGLERLSSVTLPKSVPDQARWEMADFHDVSLARGDKIYLPEIDGLFSEPLEIIPGENADSVLKDESYYTLRAFSAAASGETSLTVKYHDLSQEIKITVDGIPADQETGEDYGEQVETAGDVILESNGHLWQLYPEVKKTKSNVKEYAAGWIYNSSSEEGEAFAYTLDDQNVLWNGEKKLAGDVVEFDGRYALTGEGTLLNVANAGDEKIADVKTWEVNRAEVVILKKDGTLWARSETPSSQEPVELAQIAEQVEQMNAYRGYLKTDGTYWDYTGEKRADNVAELDGEKGYYDKDGIYYVDMGSYFVKTGAFRVKDTNWDYSGTLLITYVLTEDGRFYCCTEGQEPELLAENVLKLGWYGDWLYQTADGIYRGKNGQEVKNAIVETFSIRSERFGADYYEMVSAGNGKNTVYKNSVEILTNAVHIWNESGRIYCLRTDGTIWDITGVPQMLLNLQDPPEEAYIRGDANEDGETGIDDLRLVLRHVCRKITLEGTAYQASDVTDDGDVGIDDLRKILRFVCRKITEL